MTGLAFVVPGRPIPAARPRVTGKGTYTPRTTRVAESAVAAYARTQWRLPPTPKGTRWSVRIIASFPDHRRADVDNLAKTVMDGMTGIVYEDDDQVTELHVTRVQVDRGVGSTSVVAYLLDDDDPLI